MSFPIQRFILQLDATSQGILFTVLGVGAALLVFFLVQVAQKLFRSGGDFIANVHRIDTGNSEQVKLNLVVFNETKKDRSLSNVQLFRKNQKGELVLVSSLVDRPITRNFKTSIEENDGTYSFPFPSGVRSDLVLEFFIPEGTPLGGVWLIVGNGSGSKRVGAAIRLKDGGSQTIRFKRIR